MSKESEWLVAARDQSIPWRLWGPYLSERQWGTVREDYSDNGDAWNYFSHDQARSRAYRWGEDGLGGISDDQQQLCFALALWNGVDPILKERLFGLTNSEGNHGEDVKEYYFYLDSTPTHSFMKWLYKYPQKPFPYDQLVNVNRGRGKHEPEFELLDTGVFDDQRYFDVFMEYAKAGPEDILIRIRVCNRGPDKAALHLLPTLWFRNTWSWSDGKTKPVIKQGRNTNGMVTAIASHPELGDYTLAVEGSWPLLFTENETNTERVFQKPNAQPYVKDAFNRYVIAGEAGAVNPTATGTKAAPHITMSVDAGGSAEVRIRLTKGSGAPSFSDYDAIFKARESEADQFYVEVLPTTLGDDERRVMRQALAGMLWSKQYYYYDLNEWLKEHNSDPMSAHRRNIRNMGWYHMRNNDVISMPDKWEYPWYAAWDLAFHTVAFSMVDVDFAKSQLDLMLRESYLHPNGQIPAYEWNFGDVNPPVHAWAVNFVYALEKKEQGTGDVEFLKHAFQKLLLNFTWWVNRKDPAGRNVFDGGFLGLDNIGVFDRSAPLPTGGFLEQADGTSWMVLYCQAMFEMAVELAMHDPAYEEMAFKFIEHFLWIASAMDRQGDNADEMWDETDGFFYDLLRLPNGDAIKLKVRSMVGLLPLCAVTVFDASISEKFPRFGERIRELLQRHPERAHIAWKKSPSGHSIMSVMNPENLSRVLARLFDEREFYGGFGIRSLSKHHQDQPYCFDVGGQQYRVDYLPAESNTGMFGGNSNWRGPVWMPVNALVVRALWQYYRYFGDDYTIEVPTGSGNRVTLGEAARLLVNRLSGIFLRDSKGERPVYGNTEMFQQDPHWRDLILFYEYFHGDTGLGLGASHQTGWTGIIAKLMAIAEEKTGKSSKPKKSKHR